MKRIFSSLIIFLSLTSSVFAQKILIPMDLDQFDHLKAYGITFWSLRKSINVNWLLNYRGGSFMIDYQDLLAAECRIRGVSFEKLDEASAQSILSLVQSEDKNMDVVRLEKAPKIAVFVPPTFQPWDDAVTLALDYAEVPYEKIWDEEVLSGKLSKYDWLHLHHEDFTGQYGKFFASSRNQPWYQSQVRDLEAEAKNLGYAKVSDMKKTVARRIKEYVANGGYMFAMCSATDSYDIALAAENTDICSEVFDGDPMDPDFSSKMDYKKSFAFENYRLETDPMVYEYSEIDVQPAEIGPQENDYFTLFDYSAKFDPVPSMLTQNHVNVIKGFMGQTTMFHKRFIKKNVTILAENRGTEFVRYLYSNYG